MTDLHYYVWLQLGLGAGADIKSVLDYFETPKNVYDASVLDWAQCDAMTPARITKLTETSLEDADEIISECNKNEWSIITYGDEKYPSQLKEIERPPLVLYADGDTGCLYDRLLLAIVGTRRASQYSVKAATYLAKGIAKCGAVVVSGGALGVDSAAHRGAIEGGGVTVAVLGSGLNSDYLKSNETMRREIVENGGVLITEYPPKTRADRTTFPMRNRIISALSRGVIVVEAAEKSGSLITAECARKQGRDVFAVPSSILDPAFQGTNKLIDEGAYVATGPIAVLGRYADEYYTLDLSKAETMYKISDVNYGANAPQKKQLTFDTISENRKNDSEKQSKAESLVGVNKKIYDAIGDGLKTADEIADEANVPVAEVFAALTVLEIQGLIRKAEGDRFAKA